MNVFIMVRSLVIGEALYGLLCNDDSCNYYLIHHKRNDIVSSSPDVVITDKWCLSDDLTTKFPDAKFILLDSGFDSEEITTLIIMYRLNGVISTSEDSSLMKKSIKVVRDGQIWIDNKYMKALLCKAGTLSQKGTIDNISKREQEIINMITMGKRNKDIAADLCLSEQTIKAHISSIFKKYNVSSRNQLMSLFMKTAH